MPGEFLPLGLKLLGRGFRHFACVAGKSRAFEGVLFQFLACGLRVEQVLLCGLEPLGREPFGLGHEFVRFLQGGFFGDAAFFEFAAEALKVAEGRFLGFGHGGLRLFDRTQDAFDGLSRTLKLLAFRLLLGAEEERSVAEKEEGRRARHQPDGTAMPSCEPHRIDASRFELGESLIGVVLERHAEAVDVAFMFECGCQPILESGTPIEAAREIFVFHTTHQAQETADHQPGDGDSDQVDRIDQHEVAPVEEREDQGGRGAD